jgi:glycosyltransferase involved in cell wall biosynthesis
MKKTILHFIFNLARGGAETMLVRVIKELPEYNNIVVTLYEDNHFKNELSCSRYICLNQKSLLLFPLTALKLRRIIKQYKVDIVHTHLFWPTLIARLGVPSNIPLITTIHAFIATSVEYKKWFIRFLDKNSYRLRRSIIIGVAQGAMNEYFSFLNIKPYRNYILYTFVDTAWFNKMHVPSTANGEPLRVINIGALRVQKNQQFLVEAFKLLKDDNIELHIFGMGPLQPHLQNVIDENKLNVVLKGEVNNMNEILPRYDLFVMTSTYEGFSLGVLETMAVKVPMLLSDIVSFHEQCEETAMYFNLNDVNEFVSKLRLLAADETLRLQMSEKAYDRVIRNFTLPHHMDQLRHIYLDALNNN